MLTGVSGGSGKTTLANSLYK
jgi:adenylate kinase family enzyme